MYNPLQPSEPIKPGDLAFVITQDAPLPLSLIPHPKMWEIVTVGQLHPGHHYHKHNLMDYFHIEEYPTIIIARVGLLKINNDPKAQLRELLQERAEREEEFHQDDFIDLD